ncbi:MAG: asparagine--tRNA ligase [Candidatus Nanohaloarchaeota archaeon QJJ-9]|nr:asparagine--tRNA ligase [Candidatus Nanohaloarchaeota archaeon QJJ-9]
MYIEEAEEKGEGAEVKLRGWVYRERSSNKVAFVRLRDKTGTIQCVFKEDEVEEETFEKAADIRIESSVEIEGTIHEDERAPTGYEVHASNINVIHNAERFPITDDKSTSFLLDKRHLWIRSGKMRNMMKVRETIIDAARNFFKERGWIEVQPPLITASACEGGSTLFNLDYFGEDAYLSQSGQMYAEALTFSLEKVFAFAPSFRAEKSKTKRHVTEYWHLEPEAAWVDHEENMEIQEKLIEHICQKVVEERSEELEALGRDPEVIASVSAPFDRMTYTEAVEKLQEEGFGIEWGDDFGTPEERFLTEDRKEPLTVEKYPVEAKSFYMKSDPEKPEQVLCDDVIAPEGYGEMIGGSERETDNQVLIDRLKEEGADLDHYTWYLDLRKYGSVPHSGFGLGIERLIRWITDMDHIRDTIPFPRTPNRFQP